MKKYIIILTLALCGPVYSQDLNDGIYTSEQAIAGQKLYEGSCQYCHDMKFYSSVMRAYRGLTLNLLWETVMGTMPADSPGTFSPHDYTSIIAYIIQELGYPAGNLELTEESMSLTEVN